MTEALHGASQAFCWLLLSAIFISCSSAPVEYQEVPAETWNENDDIESYEGVAEESKKFKRSVDGYEAFMMTHGYDPYSSWGKRTNDPNEAAYLESIGYNPYFMFKRNPYPYAEEDSPDYYGSYGDVFYPQQFFHPFKRESELRYKPKEFSLRNFQDHSSIRRKRETVPEVNYGPRSKKFGEMTSSGFHGDTFSDGFGDFYTMKKKRFGGMDASGFHGDTFSDGFGGDFYTMRKRRPEMDAMGFYGDTFSDGFGSDFHTMKKKDSLNNQKPRNYIRSKREASSEQKRFGGMDASGFHGDTFSNGFGGDFYTMKRAEQQKRRPDMTASGFHGDMFSGGFGDFYPMKKRRYGGMDASGFHGDTFSDGFGGDFYTMKRAQQQKRRPEMTASGFHGDLFSDGFGDFYTMKKRRFGGMDASGFHGDTFSDGFGGDFYTMKKRQQNLNRLRQPIEVEPINRTPTAPQENKNEKMPDELTKETIR